MIIETDSDTTALKDMGRRIARSRLNRNLTQEALAVEAGVSTPTVQRIEHGHSSQTANLVRILRALGLLTNLEALIPEPAESPIQQAKLQGRKRRRASSARKHPPAEPWSWGDSE